jgi:transcriptional regulator with XRE-family HTH domain
MQVTEAARLRLKKRREELNLKFRDVEEASQQIAARKQNDDYAIALSRLSDIENKDSIPSIYRLYSLCAIYRLDYLEVLDWYGVDVSEIPGDSAQLEIAKTHLLEFRPNGSGEVQLPLALDPGFDQSRTTFLSRMIQRWGKMPLMLLNGLELKSHRYAFIGTEDWSMYPLIHPGALVVIDETRRKVQPGPWASEHERPIYFLEHREGFCLGWCSLRDKELVVLPHPASPQHPQVFSYPEEVDLVGQIVGVAMRLDSGKRRRTRTEETRR